MARIFDGLLSVHYSQAYVESSDSDGVYLEDAFRGQNNGLCGAALPGALFLITGLHTGDVGFTVDILDAPSPPDSIWEEIVEVSFTPGLGEIALTDWNANRVCDIPLLKKNYRVRYCARNMDFGDDVDTILEGESTVDFYSLTFWLADPVPDAVVKRTSRKAAYWHNWVRTLNG
ncbi:hypothetical protein K9N68_00450 [Kovacikia minuta CCNUW1]|uniref:hypothetical protein n=1 Tax=Kovacikia minuta TaxID=2931930 RepID=UPI001CC9E173|nr:hypothetical protein [Kovacikia minuta]UBF26518.1 hypothetical protein K9N68_00450 [Kovacikia minuta CCNUW1]